ncbi:MAG: 50S ribosomal protein L29 [Chitinophagales bacterium]|jgi:large subunit ribosomal protein L29|nr:50S ribosomal protein L29 [Bacteroidota bacterium]MEC8033081.1 50S ribosomal protein L29 [Bacteroidota bacterium]OUW83751.1 MAG: 50S ribosomal protein L29 [Saprospirales bacterium TMED214]
MAVRKEDIVDLSPAELVERIQEEKRMLQKLRFNHEVSSIDNPMKIRDSRRDIARLMTEYNRRKNANTES